MAWWGIWAAFRMGEQGQARMPRASVSSLIIWGVSRNLGGKGGGEQRLASRASLAFEASDKPTFGQFADSSFGFAYTPRSQSVLLALHTQQVVRWKGLAMRMTVRAARLRSISQLVVLLLVSGATVAGQLSPPSPPSIMVSPPMHSVRAAHRVTATIEVEQPSFPAEITRSTQTDSDWLQMARIAGRTAMEITSVKVGWAYALPAGLEFHKSDALTPPGGAHFAGRLRTRRKTSRLRRARTRSTW